MNPEEPLVKRDVAVGKNGSNGHAELFAAPGAFVHALTSMRFRAFFRFQLVRFADKSAVRADRTIRPSLGFQNLARKVRIGEFRGENIGFHTMIMDLWSGFVKGIIQFAY